MNNLINIQYTSLAQDQELNQKIIEIVEAKYSTEQLEELSKQDIVCLPDSQEIVKQAQKELNWLSYDNSITVVFN